MEDANWAERPWNFDENSSGSDSNRSYSHGSFENNGMNPFPVPTPREYRTLDIPIHFPDGLSTSSKQIAKYVFHCLQKGKNLLIECPFDEHRLDGIVHGVMAYWRWKHNQRNLPTPSTKTADEQRIPPPAKIFFVTKSFEESKKVISSLNRLDSSDLLRNFTMSLLGSRAEMCLNEEVKREPRDCVDNLCRRRIQNLNQNLVRANPPTCKYYSRELRQPTPLIQWNINNDHRHAHNHKVLDMEDLRRGGCRCPYFDNVQNLGASANLIVCSKEFILSSVLRQEYNINLKESIVIFDDGHNIEQECYRESSVRITAADLREACRCFTNITQGLQGPLLQIANVPQLLEILMRFSISLGSLLDWMRVHVLDRPQPSKAAILDVLRPLYEYERNSEESMINKLQSIMELSTQHNLPVPDSRIVNKIRKLLAVISYIFEHNNDVVNNGNYCMKLRDIRPPRDHPNANDEDVGILLALTSANASLVFRPIEAAAASVIVASSCLAPLPPLQTELGVDFHEIVEIPSLDSGKTFFAVCDEGPNNAKITLDFDLRYKPYVMKEVGEALLQICERIPDGVVAVFHSKDYLQELLGFWRTSANYDDDENEITLFTRLSEVKHVVSELDMTSDAERGREMLRYRNLVRNPEDEQTGALLLTLARGKINETESWSLTGVDVRGIIHISIPYGDQVRDHFMFAKVDYFEHVTRQRDSIRKKEWNHQEAFRIMNQSFGKVIQENKDWRIVIVLDKRMEARSAIMGTLAPDWVLQSGFCRFQNFEFMMTSLQTFVNDVREP